ncbi:MAG: hypothetical protein FWD92_04025 [Methanomassiliicoccaceae archaeon]|nr:hypothetical protein [Methanomassiliicoccaceae archaeon]
MAAPVAGILARIGSRFGLGVAAGATATGAAVFGGAYLFGQTVDVFGHAVDFGTIIIILVVLVIAIVLMQSIRRPRRRT